MAVAAIYLVLLLVVLAFAALWVKLIVVYVAVLFLSVVLVRGSVQLVDKGLMVNSITRYLVKFEEMKSVEIVPTAVPSIEHSSLKVGLLQPKRVLLSYALPVPVSLSEVRVDVPSSDAEELREAIQARLRSR